MKTARLTPLRHVINPLKEHFGLFRQKYPDTPDIARIDTLCEKPDGVDYKSDLEYRLKKIWGDPKEWDAHLNNFAPDAQLRLVMKLVREHYTDFAMTFIDSEGKLNYVWEWIQNPCVGNNVQKLETCLLKLWGDWD